MGHFSTIILTVFASTVLHLWTIAQDTTDFYNQIKKYDLSTVFSADSFFIEGRETEQKWIKRPEPLGYIDTNYTRFQIHYSSVTKNARNPYQYIVTGKTMVKSNICDFKGTITIKKAKLYPSIESPGFSEGFAQCNILFFEDSLQTSSGLIKGKLTCFFFFDKKGQFRYNSLMFIADGFSNNEVVGTWTSYKTGKTKKCNWGDFRIPDSRDLDIGAGEFSPADNYSKNGWQSYRDNFGNDIPTDKWWTRK